MTGLFITFEGGDGSGKTTQARFLADWLQASGRTVMHTREPGGTELGLELREIVLHRRGAISPRAEALIYAADRAHHIATKVRPAIERGDVVIQDRYLDSSVAYQGAGRVLDGTEVRNLSLWATEGFMPALTVLLDLEGTAGRDRLQRRTKYDRLESEEADFHARVRAGYLELAAAEPERFLVLNATDSMESIAAAIRARVEALLG
ncbi:MAG: dTMP kinase [Homoserinimonas sp.]